MFYPKNQLSLWFNLKNWINILTAESKTILYNIGAYSAQAIKGCIDYDLKSADNLYVLPVFCQLLLWLTIGKMHVLLLHKCIRTLPCCCCYYKQSVANTGSSIKNRRIHGLMVPCSHTENFFANLSSSVLKYLKNLLQFKVSLVQWP